MKIPPYFYSRIYNHLLPVVNWLPFSLQTRIASFGRRFFMQQFYHSAVVSISPPPQNLEKTLWGIKFRSPLANSAGMFKNGEGYELVANLGAGFYIGGTSTANSRAGNTKAGIYLPFITLPREHAAINWLGLPNLGDEALSKLQLTREKISGCPIGWSVMRSPDYPEHVGISRLINSLWLYHDNPQIDFIEINESCPNIKTEGSSIIPRLEQISYGFVRNKKRRLPVIVKVSNDIGPESLREVLRHLIKLGFDGITLGNTVTSYDELKKKIDKREAAKLKYFSQHFGGGVSGKPLKHISLSLCKIALDEINRINPAHEFHVIRSGGIDCLEDILESEKIGVALNQWYTGFFENYTVYGNQVYARMFNHTHHL